MQVKVNKWADLIERVVWTAIQAAAASAIVVLTSGMSWSEGLQVVGIAAALSVCKVLVGQNIGGDDLGAISLNKPVLEEVPAGTTLASTATIPPPTKAN